MNFYCPAGTDVLAGRFRKERKSLEAIKITIEELKNEIQKHENEEFIMEVPIGGELDEE